MSLKRININFDEELLNEIDNYASSLHVSRSSAISVIISMYFQGQKNLNTIDGLLKAMQNQSDNVES